MAGIYLIIEVDTEYEISYLVATKEAFDEFQRLNKDPYKTREEVIYWVSRNEDIKRLPTINGETIIDHDYYIIFY